MNKWRGLEAGSAESEELERLCDELGRVRGAVRRNRPITRRGAPGRRCSRASLHGAAGARSGWTAALVAVGAAAGVALVARSVVPAARSRAAGRRSRRSASSPTSSRRRARRRARLAAPSVVPEALVEPTARLDVPAGWLVRASLGDAVSVTLTGPARAWAERASQGHRRVVHLEQGLLLASLEGGADAGWRSCRRRDHGRRRNALLRRGRRRRQPRGGRARTRAGGCPPDSSGAQPRAPREIGAGQRWLTTLAEPDELEPALATALADHERTPPPRGATVPLSITEAPAGAGVWVGKRRSRPRLPGCSSSRTPPFGFRRPRGLPRRRRSRAIHTPAPFDSPSTEPSPAVSEPPARATRQAPPAHAMMPVGPGPLPHTTRRCSRSSRRRWIPRPSRPTR